MELPDRGQAKAWSGWEVLDLSGQSLGRCAGVFADTDTGVVEWLLVDVEGHRRSFVPAVDSVEEAGSVRLPFPRELVLSAPDVGDAEQLAKGDEIELYRHYDVPWTDDASGSLLPDQAVVADAAAPAPTVVAEATVAPEPEPGPEPTVLPEPEPVVQAVAFVPAAPPERPQVTPLQAGTPLAATGAGVVALWVLLRALERRASRRRSPAVRSREVGRQALRATDSARQQTGRRLAAAAAAAAEVSRQAADDFGDSAGQAAKAAQKRQRTAAKSAGKRRKAAAKTAGKRRKAAAQQRKSAAKKLGQQRKSAAKTLGQQRKSAAKTLGQQRKSAAKTLGQQRKELAQSRDHGLKALRRRRRQAGKGASAAAGAVTARTTEVTDAVAAAPAGVARSARRARRSIASTLWNALTAGAAAGGYVLGARAGRDRYEELTELGRALVAAASERPEVQTAKQAVVDAEARVETAQALREKGQQRLSQVTGADE